MKVKRQKQVRKILTFYRNNFGVKPPYSVLVDGTFCKAALTNKINLSEQLPKYLNAEVKICTTSCILKECEAFGSILYGPLKVLRQFKVVPCGHSKPVSGAAKCVLKTAGKKVHYIVGTQDTNVKDELRDNPGIPLIIIAFNAIILENPAGSSKHSAEEQLEKRIAPSDHAHSVLKKLKLATFGEEVVKQKRRKKIKGPNPLSCKVSKKKKHSLSETSGGIKKRKRKRGKKLEKSALEQLKEIIS